MDETCRPEPIDCLVLFRGDDSNFALNQSITIQLDIDADISNCTVHFAFLGFDKILELDDEMCAKLVFKSEETKVMPPGIFDAVIYLIDADGRRRTVSNRLAIKVTSNVAEAYDCTLTLSIRTTNAE